RRAGRLDDGVETQQIGRRHVVTKRLVELLVLEVADLVELPGDLGGRGQRITMTPRLQDAIAHQVDVAQDARADLARTQEVTVLGRRRPQAVDVATGPAAHEARVQQLAQRLDVRGAVGGQVVVGVLVVGRGEGRGDAQSHDAYGP